MERHALAQAGTRGVQAAKANLSSFGTWRRHPSPSASTTLARLSGSQISRRAASDPGQQGQEDRRSRRQNGVNSEGPHRLSEHTHPGDTPPPTRRVWIPKPGKPEKRPLGIPVIADRARQALVKLA